MTRLWTPHRGSIGVFGNAPSGSALSPYAAAVLADGPVGYWRLTEQAGIVAVDLIAANDGAYTGAFTLGQAGLITSTPGDTSVLFNGVTGCVLVPHSVAYCIPTTGFISIEFLWLANTDGTNQHLLGKTQAALTEYDIQRRTTGAFRENVWNGAGVSVAQFTTGALWVAATGKHHHAYTMDDVANISIGYMDGVAVGTDVTWVGATAITAANLAFGQVGNNTSFFNGRMQEVAIYDYILTPAQIAAHSVLAF